MRNVFSYLYNRTKNQIRVSFGRKIYFFVSWTSFRDFLSTNTNLTYGFPMIFHRLGTNNYFMESIIWLTIRKVPTIASVNSSLLCISYHLPFHHLHQINPTSYFLHIPEIVSTIESNSFKDKISTILHFLEHIVTQNRVKFTPAIPCSFSYVNYYVRRSRNRSVSKIEKSFIFFFFFLGGGAGGGRIVQTFFQWISHARLGDCHALFFFSTWVLWFLLSI